MLSEIETTLVSPWALVARKDYFVIAFVLMVAGAVSDNGPTLVPFVTVKRYRAVLAVITL